MNTTLAGQIQIIQHARTIIEKLEILPEPLRKSLDAGLNDAGSSLAALNLNPDLLASYKESNEMLANAFKRIKELEEVLRELLDDYSFDSIKKAKKIL